ncbi:MAG: alkylmercury lyase family protein [Gammaproteobacteria bacterium]|nr:alkylmercury lyase family protein [Gammaproteobacteria bacterium]MCW8988090.1 alkylmercury lyase family protein [Gammaproteobacteria bacterium]MCW9031661.1 alkylmercury lyase family protein [Gammaproteobacteria bacterium]
MDIEAGLNKLNSLLPLKARQDSLSPELKALHQNILRNFANKGQALEVEEHDLDMQQQLEALNKADLVVLDEETKALTGAYPFSIEKKAHHITLENAELYAMCAFDAISIAPVFAVSTKISSNCHVTKEPVEIEQDANGVISAKPSKDIYIGIKWQSTGSHAAESLCMEMVFLKDKATAEKWQGDNENIDIYPLEKAIEFGTKYFKPLID